MPEGLLISFEGIDGSGKTTQMDLLEPWLQSQDISYVRTIEPGGTQLGREIRDILFGSPGLAITPLAEAFLFAADRAQHFEDVVLLALKRGNVVITDRCFDSSIAYQGHAKGVGARLAESLSLQAMKSRIPDREEPAANYGISIPVDRWVSPWL